MGTATEQNENWGAPVRNSPVLQGALFSLAATLTAETLLGHFVNAEGTLPAMGRVTTCIVCLYVIHRFALTAFRRFRPALRDLATLTAVLMLSLLLIGLGKLLGASLSSYFAASKYLPGVHTASFDYFIPYAAGALLLRAIFGLQYSLVFAVSLSAIGAIYFPENPIAPSYILVTSLGASLSFSTFRSRAVYVKAGIQIAFLAIPLVIASVLIEHPLSTSDISARLIGAISSGLMSAVIAAGVIPALEYLGGYVTDLRLIEMATLDHTLLKELSVRCPGTWNHCMMMGMMVEAAATEVGANPVLARVGALFHDIGKLKKPLYFVENQQPGENRHDKLSSSMSALIIRSHVKDGIELAHEHHLPESIIEMIPQHHGTSLIEYFYDKACQDAEAAGEDPSLVDLNLYSYPGPKPQTKEAGILMLADGIEAATRTLPEPSFDRIQGLVQKMINKVFASGELDECELTLKDLHAIAKSFTRVLSGIYHHRIAYEETEEKEGSQADGESQAEPQVADRGDESRKDDANDEGADRSDRKEDLKRLGL